MTRGVAGQTTPGHCPRGASTPRIGECADGPRGDRDRVIGEPRRRAPTPRGERVPRRTACGSSSAASAVCRSLASLHAVTERSPPRVNSAPKSLQRLARITAEREWCRAQRRYRQRDPPGVAADESTTSSSKPLPGSERHPRSVDPAAPRRCSRRSRVTLVLMRSSPTDERDADGDFRD